MALTPAQIEARRGKLTGSRIKVLMTGSAEAVLNLYLEMIGEKPEDDLSRVWAVRLGEATEQLNLDWMEEGADNPITRRGEVVTHPHYPWAACTLDGWDEALLCPVECKCVGGREPLEVVIERYQPQLQFIMELTRTLQIALSVIVGAKEPVVEYIERDDDYIAEMMQRGAQFMDFVAKRIPPVTLPPVPPPIIATKTVDMSGNNIWGSEAFVWRETKPAADRCRDAEKILKALVPDDALKCWGHGVRVTRDKANRLSLREDK